MRILVLAVATLLFGCEANSFYGDRGNVEFQSNLRRQFRSWHPEEHVALGAQVEIVAQREKIPGSDVWVGANTTCTVTGTALVASADAGTNRLSALAANEGAAEVSCLGNASDKFTVIVSAPASVRARDPLHHYARWYGVVPADGGLSELEEPLILTADAGTWVELELFSADGGFINGVPDRFLDPVSDGGFFARVVQQQLQLEVPDLAGEREVGIAVPGLGKIDSVRFRTAQLSEAARLWLVTWEFGESLKIVKAAVEVADGGEWVQPPVEWSWSGDVALFPSDSGIDVQSRRDLRVFQPVAPPDGGFVEGAVTATIGGLSATTKIDFVTEAVEEVDAGMPPSPAPTTLCGCGAEGGGAMVLVALMLAGLGRRVRR